MRTDLGRLGVALFLGAAAVGCGDSTGTGATGAGGLAQGGGGGGVPGGGGTGGGVEQPLDAGIISALPDAVSFESESHIAVAPDGTLLVGWIDISNFEIGYGWSTDGGETWSDPAQAFPSLGDPIVSFLSDGSGYLGGLTGTCSGGREGCDNGHVDVVRSDPGTQAFGPIVDISDHDPAEFYDKPWMMTLHDDSLGVVFAGRIGNFPDDIDRIVWSSSAEGTTWERTDIVPPGSMGQLRGIPHACASGDSDRVYVLFVDLDSPISATVRWSDDNGATWPAANQSQSFALANQATKLQSYDLRCAARGDDLWIMYGLASGGGTATAIPPLEQIVVAHTTDGATFTRSDIPLAALGLRPEIVVDSAGTLHVTAYTGASDDDADGAIALFDSTDAGATWSAPEVLHQPVHFTGDRASDVWIGDYSGLATDDAHLYLTYIDNASGHAHVAFYRRPL